MTSKLAIVNAQIQLLQNYKKGLLTAMDLITENRTRAKKVHRTDYKHWTRDIPSLRPTEKLTSELQAAYEDTYREPDRQDDNLRPDNDALDLMEEAKQSEARVMVPDNSRAAK